MSGGLVNISNVWVAEEAAFRGTALAANGSDFRHVPNVDPTHIVDESQAYETNFQVGQEWETPSVPSVDGASLPIKFYARGLPTAAGDGAAPPARQVDDYLLMNIFGDDTDTSGKGVGVGSDLNSLVLDTAALGLQQLVPVYDPTVSLATLDPDQTQWRLVRGIAGAPTYDVYPDFDVAPTTPCVAYGKRTYQFARNFEGSISVMTQEDDGGTARYYWNRGGKITAADLEVASGGPAIWTANVSFDSKTDVTALVPGTISALPEPTAISQPACLGVRGSFFFADTRYEIANAKLSLKLNAGHRDGQSGPNGRVAGRHVLAVPELIVDPMFDTAFEAAFRNKTTGRLLWTFGIGVLSGGRLNTVAVHFETAQIVAYERVVDRKGEWTNRCTFRARTPVLFENTAGVLARVFQYVIA